MLLVDESMRGIELNAKMQISTVIDRLACRGLGVVIVYSELPEIPGLADRVAVLREGRKSAEFARNDAPEEHVIRAVLPRGGR